MSGTQWPPLNGGHKLQSKRTRPRPPRDRLLHVGETVAEAAHRRLGTSCPSGRLVDPQHGVEDLVEGSRVQGDDAGCVTARFDPASCGQSHSWLTPTSSSCRPRS